MITEKCKKPERCHCISCEEERAEAANDMAIFMNVADAEGGNYEDYQGYREARRKLCG